MRMDQVAAQLYTLRDHLQTPAEVASTLMKVKSIGYQAVQISGMCPMPEHELVGMLDGEGLICCATHEAPATILSNPEAVVERLNRLNCRYTAMPHPGTAGLGSLGEVKAYAAGLNAAGKVLYDAGKVLTYHNHQIEFRRVEGRLILEVIYEETDARYLQGEIDTYWVQYGGGDSVDWCRRLKGRMPLLHMKDYMITSENQPVFAEIGMGNLNWHGIVDAVQESGCEWFIVEQDVCVSDPFESLRISFDYITDHLVLP